MERRRIPAKTQWAETLSYSRAVRIGPYIAVSQTSAVDSTGAIQGADAYSQALYALQNVEEALREAGAKLTDVIRTRIYLARFDDWTEVARAHGKIFAEVRPTVSLLTCTMVTSEILVEFEVDAIVSGEPT